MSLSLPRFSRLCVLKLQLGGVTRVFGHPGCDTGYYNGVILTPEGKTAFTQQANDIVESLCRHIR